MGRCDVARIDTLDETLKSLIQFINGTSPCESCDVKNSPVFGHFSIGLAQDAAQESGEDVMLSSIMLKFVPFL